MTRDELRKKRHQIASENGNNSVNAVQKAVPIEKSGLNQQQVSETKKYFKETNSTWNKIQDRLSSISQSNIGKFAQKEYEIGSRVAKAITNPTQAFAEEAGRLVDKKVGNNLRYSFTRNRANYGKGNIDLNNRPVVKNEDGSISTIRSMSFYDDKEKKEILIPTVVGNRVVSDQEAIDHYYKTGEYLGKFNTPEEADKYAEELHLQQEQRYGQKVGNNLLFIGKKTGAGALSGTTGIASAYVTDTANELKKGEKKTKTEAITNAINTILEPDETNIIRGTQETIKGNIDIIKDKNKNTWQKIAGVGQNTASGAINAMPFKRKTNAVIQAVGSVFKGAGDKALEVNQTINKPSQMLNQALAEEANNYGKLTQYAGDAMQSVGNMLPSIATTAVTGDPTARVISNGYRS